MSLIEKPNRETYAYFLLLMSLPFRNVNEQKNGDPPFYNGKLGAAGVIDIIKKDIIKIFS